MPRGKQRVFGRKFFGSLPPHRKPVVNNLPDFDDLLTHLIKRKNHVDMPVGLCVLDRGALHVPSNDIPVENLDGDAIKWNRTTLRYEPVSKGVSKVDTSKCYEDACTLMAKFNKISLRTTRRGMKKAIAPCLAANCDDCWAIRKRQRRKPYGCCVVYRSGIIEGTPERRLKDMLAVIDPATWVFIGKGHFGIVFKHKPSGLAVKFTGYYRGGRDDYLRYADLAKEYTHNPMFPKIHGYHRSVNVDGGDVYFCISEQLQCASGELSSVAARLVEARTRRMAAPLQAAQRLFDNKQLAYLLELREVLRETGKSFDLHSGNWMQTKDGQLVCTDPWC